MKQRTFITQEDETIFTDFDYYVRFIKQEVMTMMMAYYRWEGKSLGESKDENNQVNHHNN